MLVDIKAETALPPDHGMPRASQKAILRRWALRMEAVCNTKVWTLITMALVDLH